MPRVRIDNMPVEVEQGATVLDAARRLGLDIPSLCYLPGCTAQSSCLACVVRINGSPRLVPSCSTLAADGMVVESETDSVRSARRTALELLLADHAGDCLAPCQGGCPARLDIPAMVRHIQAGDIEAAALTARQALVLPATLGRICPQLCEKGCRRAQLDSAVAICALHRHAADYELASFGPELPPRAASTGQRIAIVGAGPCGLSAAWELLQAGHDCTVFDEHPAPGGGLRYAIAPDLLPPEVLDGEIELIVRLGAELRMNTRVGKDIALDELRRGFDAVILATGTPAGDLPDGVFAASAAGTEHAVRAIAEGRAAAQSAHRHLAGLPPSHREPAFTSRLGKMSQDELQVFFSAADPALRPGFGTLHLTQSQAYAEAGRCMSCDCASLDTCRLRRYAMLYQARPSRFRHGRRRFDRISTHPLVVYEPGKCIACGLCVQIASDAAEPLGLAYIGRGFDVRIGVPFNADLADGLQKTAVRCTAACPTGAIHMKGSHHAR